MQFHWNRLGRLGIPLAIAFTFAAILQEIFGLSRLTAVPAGLWVAVQINNIYFAPRWAQPVEANGAAARKRD